MSRVRRRIVLLSGVLALLLAAPLAAIWYAMYTPGGVALALRLTPHRLPGAELRFEGVRGTLARSLHADLVEVHTLHANVLLRNVDLEPSLRLAVLQTLRLRSASVDSAQVQILPRPPSNRPLYFLPYWLSIQVDTLRVGQLHVLLPSGRRFDASQFSASGSARPRVIRYHDARMQTGGLAWRSDAGILHGGRAVMGLDARLTLDYHTAGKVPWNITLDGHGDLNTLGLGARFRQPFEATYTGQALALAADWRLKGDLVVKRIDLHTWGGNPALGEAHGSVHLDGNLDGFSAQGPVLMDRLEAGTLDMRLKAAYASRRLSVTEAEFQQPQAGWRVLAHGGITVVPGGPLLDLAGSWNDLRLPLAARPGVVRSHAATFTVAGTWPYHVHSAGDLEVPDLPALDYILDAQLHPDHAEVSAATLALAGASARFAGRLSWPPRLDWAATGSVANFDPASVANMPHGRVSFGFDARGAGARADSDFAVSVRDLAGTLRELPLHGAGSVARQASTWRFDSVRTQVGGAMIALDGSLGRTADVKFDVRAPDLSLLPGGWRGRLAAAGILRGTVQDPAINATVTGGALQYGQITVGELDARIDADTHRSTDSHLLLHVRNLAAGSRRIDEVQLTLDGATVQHRLALRLRAPGIQVDGGGSGSFDHGAWRADLADLRVLGGDATHLQLATPATLLLAAGSARLSQLCLTGQPGKLCATGDWSPERWALAATASDLPMQALTAAQTGNLDYRGIIGLSLALSGGAGQRTTGVLDAQLAGAQLLHRLTNGRIETTTLGSGNVQVRANPGDIVVTLGLDAGPVGSLSGQFNVQRNAAGWRDMPLSGQLRLRTDELDFIPLYVPQVDRAAGRLDAGLTLSGTLGTPLLDGDLSLAEGELDLYRVNLGLRGAGISARLSGNSLEFSGAARLGTGHAEAHGRLQWQDSAPHGAFTLTGDNLRVADVPEAQVDASPNLGFSIDGTRIAVTGSVNIPHAHLAPADLTNAVLPSSDEVVVNKAQPQDPAARFTVTSDITLRLGDDVSIDTRGLKAHLGGSITTHVGSDEQVTRATGEVNVTQGEYTAYGRKLTIDRGRLIFSGGPVADPGIDVRAVKHFDDPTTGATLAGINVRGTLRSPRLSFFSEPPLPQQEIVQLILAGGGLMAGQTSSVAGSTAASRGATNNELLGQGAAIIGQQLGSKIGITDVGVESNIYNETSLVLGRYLSPRLYVSYGLGLTQTLNTVKLRYTLGDHWMLRTEAGQVGGADIVYTLDK